MSIGDPLNVSGTHWSVHLWVLGPTMLKMVHHCIQCHCCIRRMINSIYKYYTINRIINGFDAAIGIGNIGIGRYCFWSIGDR